MLKYVNKRTGLSECNISYKWYFLEKNFRFQPNTCNGSHDLQQEPISFNFFVVVSSLKAMLIELIFVV